MSNFSTRQWAELTVFLAAAVLALPAGPAEAQSQMCQCRAELDPCLVGDWLVPSEAVHPHWRASAAHHLGMKVNRTVGQVELVIRGDRLFHARIALDSSARGQAGLRLTSRVTGNPVGRICVSQDGKLCTYSVRGDITVSNQIKLAGRSVSAPGMVVPAAGDKRKKKQAYPYRCTNESLEFTFVNLGKRQRITAQRR